MPLTKEQFIKAREAGFTTEQIIGFEKRRSEETKPREQPQERESPLRESYREGLGQTAHAISQIVFGLPEFAAQKISPRFKEAIFPEPRTSEGKNFRAATDIYSLFGGGAARLAGKTAIAGIKGGVKELAKRGLAEKTKRAALSGAVYGGTQLEPDSTAGGQVGKAAATAAGGAGLVLGGAGLVAAGKGVAKTGKVIKDLPLGWRATRNEASFGDRVMEAFANKRIKQMEIFGEDLKNLSVKYPQNPVDYATPMQRAKTLIEETGDKELLSLINSNPQLRKFMENSELARNLSAEEAQGILNKINQIANKKGSRYFQARDFYYDLREAMLNAFPEGEVGAMREKYREVAEPYSLIKNKIKEGNILRNLANKFGDAQLNRRAESLMTEGIKKEVDAYRRTKKLLKVMGYAGQGVATGAGLGAVGGRIYQLTK